VYREATQSFCASTHTHTHIGVPYLCVHFPFPQGRLRGAFVHTHTYAHISLCSFPFSTEKATQSFCAHTHICTHLSVFISLFYREGCAELLCTHTHIYMHTSLCVHFLFYREGYAELLCTHTHMHTSLCVHFPFLQGRVRRAFAHTHTHICTHLSVFISLFYREGYTEKPLECAAKSSTQDTKTSSLSLQAVGGLFVMHAVCICACGFVCVYSCL